MMNLIGLTTLTAMLLVAGFATPLSPPPVPVRALPTLEAPEPPSRRELGSRYSARLEGQDRRVRTLSARCAQVKVKFEPEFEQLRVRRMGVMVALTNLRDPSIGLEPACHAIETSLGERRAAIDGLSAKIDAAGQKAAPSMGASR